MKYAFNQDFERELMDERKLRGEDADGNTGWTSVDIDIAPADIKVCSAQNGPVTGHW